MGKHCARHPCRRISAVWDHSCHCDSWWQRCGHTILRLWKLPEWCCWHRGKNITGWRFITSYTTVNILPCFLALHVYTYIFPAEENKINTYWLGRKSVTAARIQTAVGNHCWILLPSCVMLNQCASTSDIKHKTHCKFYKCLEPSVEVHPCNSTSFIEIWICM